MTLAAELAGWWVVAVGVWMASLSAYSAQDLVVAAGCAVPCAAAAAGARRAVRGRWRPPAAGLRWSAWLPIAVVADTVRVLALPLRLRRRGRAGEFRTVDLHAAGDSAAASGRRAVASLLLSATPATYVVALDPDEGSALVHGVGAPSPIERAVTR